jgi:hypothetical protein
MTGSTTPAEKLAPDETKVNREARRILRRLCETGAFLAVAPEMEKAVVLKESSGRQSRIAVVERDIAHAFALREWISCARPGRISCYGITSVGRTALKRLIAEDLEQRKKPSAYAEKPSPFQEQHREFDTRHIMHEDGSGPTRIRYNLAESPLTVLGRKRDKHGEPYLTPTMIEAGERLREDFELAQLGPRVAQNWDRFQSAVQSTTTFTHSPSEGSQFARDRLNLAMSALGPGLSDIVFRVCCFLEGLEAAEKRLGWSARSGKVVLKIALSRLADHYGHETKSLRRVG